MTDSNIISVTNIDMPDSQLTSCLKKREKPRAAAMAMVR